jgi:DNA-binding IclR family transcriptional regulator
VSQATALRAKRQRGIPIKALMEEYGLSRATVHRYLKPPTT